MRTSELFTFSVASVGAVLGIINTVTALNQQRVKLVVRVKSAFLFPPTGGTVKMFSIQVTNLSSFPVFISEVGFEIYGRSERLVIMELLTSDHQPFTRKLESRASIIGFFEDAGDDKTRGRSYVRTDRGEQRFGNKLQRI
jgi:hypothetical protein